jgi:MarR-like DNA-binding transcriptional regulator SgrR of sgrS sRNA
VSTEPMNWFTSDGINRRFYRESYKLMKLLAYICEHNGEVITVREFADCFGCTERHVYYCIAEAKHRGLIRMEGSNGHARRYWLVTEGNPDAR